MQTPQIQLQKFLTHYLMVLSPVTISGLTAYVGSAGFREYVDAHPQLAIYIPLLAGLLKAIQAVVVPTKPKPKRKRKPGPKPKRKVTKKHAAIGVTTGLILAAGASAGMIDLSNNNGPGAARAISNRSVYAVMAKATEGLHFRDADYPGFRAASEKAHKPFGAYLFLHPDESGKAQADYFLSYARPTKGDLQPVVDSEIGSACAAAPTTFAALHRLQVKGYSPILYSNTSWLGQFARCAPQLESYPVWEAEYGPRLTFVPGFRVIAWQFTDKARVNGLSVDGSQILVRNLKQLQIR